MRCLHVNTPCTSGLGVLPDVGLIILCSSAGSQPVNKRKCTACVVEYSCFNYCANNDAGHQRGTLLTMYSSDIFGVWWELPLNFPNYPIKFHNIAHSINCTQ